MVHAGEFAGPLRLGRLPVFVAESVGRDQRTRAIDRWLPCDPGVSGRGGYGIVHAALSFSQSEQFQHHH
jgi:hypothetical protein